MNLIVALIVTLLVLLTAITLTAPEVIAITVEELNEIGEQVESGEPLTVHITNAAFSCASHIITNVPIYPAEDREMVIAIGNISNNILTSIELTNEAQLGLEPSVSKFLNVVNSVVNLENSMYMSYHWNQINLDPTSSPYENTNVVKEIIGFYNEWSNTFYSRLEGGGLLESQNEALTEAQWRVMGVNLIGQEDFNAFARITPDTSPYIISEQTANTYIQGEEHDWEWSITVNQENPNENTFTIYGFISELDRDNISNDHNIIFDAESEIWVSTPLTP